MWSFRIAETSPDTCIWSVVNMVPSTSRAFRRIEADLARVERRTENEMARILRAIRRAFLQQNLSRPVRIHVTDDMVEVLAAGMTLAEQLGRRRSRLEAEKLALAADKLLSEAGKLSGHGGRQKSAQVFQLTAREVLGRETRRVQRLVNTEVTRGVASNLPPEEIAKLVKKRFDAAGLSPRNPHSIATLVRTHTAMALSAGQWNEDNRDPAIRNALWGYMYKTRGDDRVRPHHRDLDDVTLPKEHPFWQSFFPPNDWNCRCHAIPIFEPRELRLPPSHVRPARGFSFNPGVVFRSVL